METNQPSVSALSGQIPMFCPWTILSPHLATVIFPQCLGGVNSPLWFVVLLLVWFCFCLSLLPASGRRGVAAGGRQQRRAAGGCPRANCRRQLRWSTRTNSASSCALACGCLRGNCRRQIPG